MIKSIEFKDVGKFEDLRIEPKSITVLKGSNGVGKSTVLKALSDVFDGGHDPSIIRGYGTNRAAKKAVILITLTDGTEIRKAITPKGSTTEVKTEDGTIVPSPGTYLKKLASGFALDPITFIEAGKRGAAGQKERMAFLQAALNQEVTAEEVAKCTDLFPREKSHTWDMDGLDALIKDCFQRRTAANSKAEALEGSHKTLKKQLPAGTPGADWKAVVVKEEATLAAMKADLQTALTQVDDELKAKLDDIRRAFDTANENARRVAEERRVAVRNAVAGDIEAKVGDVAAARERAENQATQVALQSQLATIEQQRNDATDEANALDDQVTRLRELKRRKMEASPLPGLEIRDGKIYYEEKEFDSQLNTAQQYMVAFQLAALNAGDLGLMICDRAESLEEGTTQQEFTEGAEAAGFQVIMARVAPGPFEVETQGALSLT